MIQQTLSEKTIYCHEDDKSIGCPVFGKVKNKYCQCCKLYSMLTSLHNISYSKKSKQEVIIKKDVRLVKKTKYESVLKWSQRELKVRTLIFQVVNTLDSIECKEYQTYNKKEKDKNTIALVSCHSSILNQREQKDLIMLGLEKISEMNLHEDILKEINLDTIKRILDVSRGFASSSDKDKKIKPKLKHKHKKPKKIKSKASRTLLNTRQSKIQ